MKTSMTLYSSKGKQGIFHFVLRSNALLSAHTKHLEN